MLLGQVEAGGSREQWTDFFFFTGVTKAGVLWKIATRDGLSVKPRPQSSLDHLRKCLSGGHFFLGLSP